MEPATFAPAPSSCDVSCLRGVSNVPVITTTCPARGLEDLEEEEEAGAAPNKSCSALSTAFPPFAGTFPALGGGAFAFGAALAGFLAAAFDGGGAADGTTGVWIG